MNIKENIKKIGDNIKERINGKTIYSATGKTEEYEGICEQIIITYLEKGFNFTDKDFRKFTRSMFYLLGGSRRDRSFQSNEFDFTDHLGIKKTTTFNKNGKNYPYIGIQVGHSTMILMPNVEKVRFESNGSESSYEPTFVGRITNKAIMIRPDVNPSYLVPITEKRAFNLCRKLYEAHKSKEQIS